MQRLFIESIPTCGPIAPGRVYRISAYGRSSELPNAILPRTPSLVCLQLRQLWLELQNRSMNFERFLRVVLCVAIGLVLHHGLQEMCTDNRISTWDTYVQRCPVRLLFAFECDLIGFIPGSRDAALRCTYLS